MNRVLCLFLVWVALAGLAARTSAAANADVSPAPQASGLPVDVPYARPTDPMQIARIDLPQGAHGGDTVSGRVITSSNVAALTARVGSYQIDVPKIAPGTFALAVHVPHLLVPWYRAKVVITAIRADGLKLEQTTALTIRY